MNAEQFRPIIDHLDPERAHTAIREILHLSEKNPLTLKLLERFFLSGEKKFQDPRLKVTLGEIELESPTMVGAGWDKNGRAIKALHHLGFSGVEIGSVLAYPQYGQDKPRVFMLNPEVVLNRMGFPSEGMDAVAENLERYRNSRIPIGINISKNKDIPNEKAPAVYAAVVKTLNNFASYFVVNVSSPNTPGLRELQDKKPLTDIVQATKDAMKETGDKKPIFIKIAPDLTDTAVDDVIDVVLSENLTGIIATNTTNNPQIKESYGSQWKNESGGVSGNDPYFRMMASQKIAHIYSQVGDRIQIVGVGGISHPAHALEKIKFGATAIQVVTGIRTRGFSVANEINQGIVKEMERQKMEKFEDLIGSEIKK